MTFDDLIERLERATGPDRELDWQIWFETATEPAAEWPHYTHSINDALALVPPGRHWSINSRGVARVGGGSSDDYVLKGGEHRSPAIALCIAALKARGLAHSSAKGQDHG